MKTFEEITNLQNQLKDVYAKRNELFTMKDELRKKIREIEEKIAPDKEMINNFENQVKDRWTEIEDYNKKEQTLKDQMRVITYQNYYELTKNGAYSDEDTIAFRDESWNGLVLLENYEDLTLFYKYDTDGKTQLRCDRYQKISYEDRLDEMKDEAYNNDNFLRDMRIEDIRNNYNNDSLYDYLNYVWVEDISTDDLQDDPLEDNYVLNELEQLEYTDWEIVFDDDKEYFELIDSKWLWVLS